MFFYPPNLNFLKYLKAFLFYSLWSVCQGKNTGMENITISSTKTTTRQARQRNIVVCSGKIEQVDTFKYVVADFSKVGGIETELDIRISAAIGRLHGAIDVYKRQA